jgi:hypothetical protein
MAKSVVSTTTKAYRGVGDGSVGIVTRLQLDSWQGREIFYFFTASIQGPGLTQPFIQWVPEAISLGIAQSELETNHSSPFNTEFN